MGVRSLRVVVGASLILHGLGMSVLPLRGATTTASGASIPLLAALALVAIVGFVVAGLGTLGVRPLHRAASVSAGAAGLCALAVQFWPAGVDLWPGVLLSAGLPLATVLLNPPHLPRPHHRWSAHLLDAAGWALLLWVGTSAIAWPWHRGWGTTAMEWEAPLPGDRRPRTPQFETLRAVTIDAPPSAVWPSLVQIGQNRPGFSSDVRLERLIGNRRGRTIDLIQPERSLVLHRGEAFVLQPLPNNRTRFLIRSTISHDRIPTWVAALNFTAFELPHFLMQRRMMLGIKARAEQRRHDSTA